MWPFNKNRNKDLPIVNISDALAQVYIIESTEHDFLNLRKHGLVKGNHNYLELIAFKLYLIKRALPSIFVKTLSETLLNDVKYNLARRIEPSLKNNIKNYEELIKDKYDSTIYIHPNQIPQNSNINQGETLIWKFSLNYLSENGVTNPIIISGYRITTTFLWEKLIEVLKQEKHATEEVYSRPPR